MENSHHDKNAPPGAFALSIDVEDYFQVWAFSDVITRKSWDGFELRVGETTRRCLDLFDQHRAKATFFILGWVAERDRALIREIYARGHEVASHGYDHTKVFEQSRTAFAEDVSKTKKILEDISGAAVTGYRAAGFSINSDTPWAHDVLLECGHRYSSSSHPISHDHYGDPTAQRGPYKPISGASFIEAPVATVDIFGRRVSCAGGGWFRATPTPISKWMMARAARTIDGPVIFYFHPWEIDSDQPRISGASRKARLRHYLNIDRMHGKLSSMLGEHDWARIDASLSIEAAA